MTRELLAQIGATKPELAGLPVIANVDFGHTTPTATFPIGGTVEVPHGVACAALLVATIKANVAALRARQPTSPSLEKYREVARLLTGRGDAVIEDGIAWIEQTVLLLGIGKLASYGLRPEQADYIVARARLASSTKGNPIELSPDELHAVLASSL